jgi:hypothetical protein
MARKSSSFEKVKRLGLALPDVEVSTAYGASCLKVRGQMFACPAINKSAEPNSLMVRIDFAQRDELLAADPDTYYVTGHYEPYPCVVVRLSRIHPDALKDLLAMAHRFMASKKKRPIS